MIYEEFFLIWHEKYWLQRKPGTDQTLRAFEEMVMYHQQQSSWILIMSSTLSAFQFRGMQHHTYRLKVFYMGVICNGIIHADQNGMAQNFLFSEINCQPKSFIKQKISSKLKGKSRYSPSKKNKRFIANISTVKT